MRSDERTQNPAPLDDELNRIGIAVPASLLEQFDRLIEKKGYGSRSEACRDLMRDALIEDSVGDLRGEAVGTLTLVYDHHIRQLNDRLVGMQHDHHDQIVSTIHVHLDHHSCLEVVILRGNAKDIQHIADSLIATKGVRHGKLTLTTATAR
ncbi:MAG: nickel-responsive transcriptional regulator NikR [Bryobacteraceae bacterium]|jgi:CopG family transcriptional regulator, nickel-responsive regulator